MHDMAGLWTKAGFAKFIPRSKSERMYDSEYTEHLVRLEDGRNVSCHVEEFRRF